MAYRPKQPENLASNISPVRVAVSNIIPSASGARRANIGALTPVPHLQASTTISFKLCADRFDPVIRQCSRQTRLDAATGKFLMRNEMPEI